MSAHCPKCGLEIRGSDPATCPECGTVLTASGSTSRGEVQPYSRRGAWPAQRVVLVVLTFVALALAAFVVFGSTHWGLSAMRDPAVQAQSLDDARLDQLAIQASDSNGTSAANSPEDAVRAWYEALALGETDAVRRTATPVFAQSIDPAMLQARDPSTRYVLISTERDGDTARVYVEESPTDSPTHTTFVFVVVEERDGTWLVDSVEPDETGAHALDTPAPGENP
jgi:hypothetical protein